MHIVLVSHDSCYNCFTPCLNVEFVSRAPLYIFNKTSISVIDVEMLSTKHLHIILIQRTVSLLLFFLFVSSLPLHGFFLYFLRIFGYFSYTKKPTLHKTTYFLQKKIWVYFSFVLCLFGCSDLMILDESSMGEDW